MNKEIALPPNVVLFTPDITDTTTIRRVEEFADHGFRTVVLGFRRARYNRHFTPPWPHVLLGETQDAKYWRRLRALIRAIPVFLAAHDYMRDAPLFYARNIEQLLLALLARRLFNPNATVAYEILDVQPIFARAGVIPALLRMIERICLRDVRFLVLSSPGFYWNYFVRRQRYRGSWFLLENKLHRSALIRRPPVSSSDPEDTSWRNGYKWVIGYFGLIRGEATFDLMTRVAARLRGQVLFRFRGVLTTVGRQRFFDTLSKHENMVYEGEYENPRDLNAIYRTVDFAWALDLENVEDNSSWLLPCRFYEAGCFGVPCLTVRGFEVGNLVERLDVGWAFDQPLEDALVAFFQTLSRGDYDEKRRRLLAMPESTFLAGEDIAAFCASFAGQAAEVVSW